MLEYKYFIQRIYQPATDLVVLEVADKNGSPVFDFKPGQYAMISYKNAQGRIEDKHAFSIASSPTQQKFLTFGIKVMGTFTQGLLKLKEGDELIVSGPFGVFVYDEKENLDAVFVAGGIGITPFLSSLHYATDLKLKNKFEIIYSAKTKSGSAFYEEICDLEKRNPNISALYSFTDEKGDENSKTLLHRRITTEDIKTFIGNPLGKTFFICGPSPFMVGMIANLMSLGVKKEQIKMEEFSMIPDQSLMSRLKNLSYTTSFAIILFVLSFFFITRASTADTLTKSYDPAQLNLLNRAAYERMISIYKAKNVALADLNNQIIAANTQIATNTNNPTTVATAPTIKPVYVPPVSNPIIQKPATTKPVTKPTNTPSVNVPATPAPVYVPPVYVPPTPAPTPTTRVS